MSEIYLSKFLKYKKNSLEVKCFLYIKTKWNNEDMEITLQDSETGKCYQGSVTEKHFQEVANDLETSYIEYKKICQQLLTNNNYSNNNNFNFIYELVDNDSDSNESGKQLLIRKLPINCLYLDINLRSTKNHYDIFDTALELLHNKDICLKQHIHIAQNHDKHYKELHENMERMIDEKNQLERNLLKKVLGLLNAKKERILELERHLKMRVSESHNNDSDNNEDSYNDDIPGTSRDYRKRQVITSDTDSTDNDKDNDNDDADESGCIQIDNGCNIQCNTNNESDDGNFLADTEVLNF